MSHLDKAPMGDGDSSIKLEKMFILSILFHIVVVAIVVISPTFSFKKTFDSSFYMVNLVSAPSEKPLTVEKKWITKDIRKTEPVKARTKPKPLKKIAKKVPIAPVKKEVIREKVFPKKVSTKKNIATAVKKIKRETSAERIDEAISRIKKDLSTQEDKNNKTTGAYATKDKGGIVGSKTTDLRLKIYYTIIWGEIKKSWILPEGIVKNQKNIEAIISFKILKNGEIKDIRFEKSSGNSYFDKSVLRAIEKADPLPPLPEKIDGKYLDVGVRFHPSDDF